MDDMIQLSGRHLYIAWKQASPDDQRDPVYLANKMLDRIGYRHISSLDERLPVEVSKLFSLNWSLDRYCERNSIERGAFNYKFFDGEPLLELMSTHNNRCPLFFVLCSKPVYTICEEDGMSRLEFIPLKDGKIYASAGVLDVTEFKKIQEQFDKDTQEVQKKTSKTYLMIDDRNGKYKIGKSINPSTRERTFQSDVPSVRLILVCQKDIELKLHCMFDHKRDRGEWFNLDDDDVRLISGIFMDNN